MPNAKSTILTINNMDLIFRRHLFCPKQSDTTVAQIADKPGLALALEAVCHELGKAQEASKKALLEELKTKTADVDWLLIVLKVLNPSHEMFQPGYVKPKKATHKQCIDNERL